MESIAAVLEALSILERELDGAPSLAGGTAGLATLHGYLAQTENGQDHAAAAARCLQRAIHAVADEAGSAALYGGLTDPGWTLAHLQGRLPGLESEDELAEIDQVLLEHLEQSPWPDTYDLIGGLVGFGVYALERGPAAGAVACLERVIERLAETAEHRPDGITWVSCEEWVPLKYRARYPARYYNLGLAHGVPGVVALLALACAAGVAVTKARPLLDGTVRWLLAQQTPQGFPAVVSVEKPPEPAARLAWCYGDPGVAAALLGAARCVQEPAWEQAARAIACRAAGRPAEQAGVVDASLCHGAAGLGHLFNRMFQATHDAHLADAARFWFGRTFEMQRPGRGIGGYETWGPDEKDEMTWVADSTFLTGAAGIALALVAATTSIEPNWDRKLLVAVSPLA